MRIQPKRQIKKNKTDNIDQHQQLQKQKKELANVYKQIEMYKGILNNLRAKEISTQSVDKLNQIENKIRYQDQTIENLQKQIKYLGNIRDQQQKELNLLENHDVKTSVLEMEEQVKRLKEKFKNTKKRTKKMQEMGKKQHIYFMQLEKTLRKHNDEYFAGKNETKRHPRATNLQEDITQRQWQVVKVQLNDLKKTHQDHNKKIEQLTRQRNKQIKSCEQNQIRIKDKLRKLQSVKTKLEQVAKLVSVGKEGGTINEESQEHGNYEYTIINGKKVYKNKNQQNQRGAKKWMIPQGYNMQKGKIMPDSIFFTDKTILKNAKKSKIIQVHIWLSSSGRPCIMQFKYMNQQDKILDGIQIYPSSVLANLEEKIIEYKEGDYVNKIRGKMSDGFLTSITFISKFGRKEQFNPEASGQAFKFDPRPNEIPSCFYGALVKNDDDDDISISYLGCEFIEDW